MADYFKSALEKAQSAVQNPAKTLGQIYTAPFEAGKQIYETLSGGFGRATGPITPEAQAFAPQPYQAEMKRAEQQLGGVGKEYFLPGTQTYGPERTGFFAKLAGPGKQVVTGGKTFQDVLAEQMMGKAPSIAESQMKQSLERSLAAQRAGLAQTRGVSPALAQTLMARQAGTMGADIAQQAGIARLQEQRAAQEMFAGEMARQDAMKRFYEAQRTGDFAAMQQAQQDLERLKVGAKTESRKTISEIVGKLGGAVISAGA